MVLTSTLEVVEILFARGLVKVLFATETFAMVRTIIQSFIAPTDAWSGCQHARQMRGVLAHQEARRAQYPVPLRSAVDRGTRTR